MYVPMTSWANASLHSKKKAAKLFVWLLTGLKMQGRTELMYNDSRDTSTDNEILAMAKELHLFSNENMLTDDNSQEKKDVVAFFSDVGKVKKLHLMLWNILGFAKGYVPSGDAMFKRSTDFKMPGDDDTEEAGAPQAAEDGEE